MRSERSIAGSALTQLLPKAELEQRVDDYLASAQRREGKRLAPTPSAKQVIARALEEARRAGKRTADTGDILLAFLYCDEGPAAKLLGEAGVTLSSLRPVIRQMSSSLDDVAL